MTTEGRLLFLAVRIAALALGCGYLALAVTLWRRRGIRGAREAAVMLGAVALWTWAYTGELSSQTPATARMWSTVEFGSSGVALATVWALAFRYVGREPLARRSWALLLAEPLGMVTAMLWPATADLVVWYPSGAGLRRIQDSPVPEPGPLYWVHVAYGCVTMMLGLALIGRHLLRVPRPYRRSALVLFAVTVLPPAAAFVFLLPPGGPRFDPTPFAGGLTALALSWGLLRPRLLDVPAVTRNVVVERLTDAVLLLDPWGRIADGNPAAATLLGTDRHAMLGRPAQDLLPALADALAAPVTSGSVDLPGTILLPPGPYGDGPRHAVVSLTGVTGTGGDPVARIAVVRDVTDRALAARRLEELLDERTAVLATLEHSLRPTDLPAVPGLRLTGRWVPAGSGASVSGDFYDVHPAGDGAWAFVIGDVSGKGVHAAVVTSVARQTVRAVSTLVSCPHAVLTRLHETLLSPDHPERFCTVLYGRVHPPSGDVVAPRDGVRPVRITLALGGHPAPLLRRADGTITAVGRPGTVLGLVPDIEIHSTTVDLAPGDLLLAFTDGVTEARRGRSQFGEEGLARLLDEVASAPATRGDLEAIADEIVTRVLDYGDHPDDVALLALTVPAADVPLAPAEHSPEAARHLS